MSSSVSHTNNTDPALCSNGCGFFGSAATQGLCSKCYRDLTKSLSPPPLSNSALTIKPTPSSSSPVSDATSVEKTKKKRCGMCNKKVGLTGFQCRCGNMFCGSHRYPEEHDCDFDFKAKGRSEVAKANPVVKADKLKRYS